jgi:hypothetical protein
MRRALRSPFVITLAALSAACSGSSSDAPTNDADATTQDDTNEPPVDADVHTSIADALSDAGDVDAHHDARPEVDAPINPPECPPTDPGFGAKIKPCSAPSTVTCSYVDDCDLRPADAGPPYNVYLCHDTGSGAHWTLVGDYTPDCPAIAPAVGDPCPCSPHMLYVACLFGTCEALNRVFYDCQTADEFQTTWKSTPVSCNPPEPDGGLDGDATDGG